MLIAAWNGMVDTYGAFASWTNDNEGVLALLIFVATVLFGWFSGIFAALRRRPKLKIDLIPGPNFCSSFPTGRQHNGNPTHHTALSLYFSIKNVGSADTTIAAIHVGYHPRLAAFKWRFKRLWIVEQAAALGDFRVNIGGNIKVYPFLFQRNFLMSSSEANTFAPVGGRCVGVCYWEQPESWGGFFPAVDQLGKVNIKVRVLDIYDRRYKRRFKIPMVPLEQARVYHPEFGMTHESLRAGQQQLAGDSRPPPAEPPLWD